MKTFLSLQPAFPHLGTLILKGIGQPPMHPRLEEFIAISRRSLSDFAWVGFQTNRLLLNENHARSRLDSGLFRICLSVDGEDFEHDCYTGLVPCGACLWCTGLFHCRQ